VTIYCDHLNDAERDDEAMNRRAGSTEVGAKAEEEKGGKRRGRNGSREETSYLGNAQDLVHNKISYRINVPENTSLLYLQGTQRNTGSLYIDQEQT
jgi:hypothetical protein